MQDDGTIRAGDAWPGFDTFPDPDRDLETDEGERTAVLAGACFWCNEAVYRMAQRGARRRARLRRR